jgi:predicted CXXCH cytochrome family protein
LPRAGEIRLMAFALLAAACGRVAVSTDHAPATGDVRGPAPAAEADAKVGSNVLRGDYVGSATCEPCHHDVYTAWSRSPMHRMTRAAASAETRAPFDGRSFHFKNDSVTLSAASGERFLSISSPEFGHHVYRVTRVIGGRHREDFAGVEVAEGHAGAPLVADSRDEWVLPVSYVYDPPSLRLKGYSVMVAERPGLRAGGVWNRTCIFCHNTVPYLSTVFGALLGPEASSYQGEVVDRVLPADRRARLVVTSPSGLERAATDEIHFLERRNATADGEAVADLREALEAALATTRDDFAAADLVELGIGCESCHGGSRRHALDPRVKPTFELKSALFRAEPSTWEASRGASPAVVALNRTCARCHQVLFSRYPFTWEGGRRNGDAGGSHISSGEARDFLLGGCTTALTCVSCHDPHAADPADKLAALERPAGNGVCTRCHADKAGEASLAAHSHHRPDGAGAACINCHMPKKNMGLSYELTRYHRIGSPTERARVERDRPLECALCHADKRVGDLVSTMERWWKKSYDRDRLLALYGDLEALPLAATAEHGKAHEQATALAVLGNARVAPAAAIVAEQMLNPYPLVRYYARQALGAIAGRTCEVSLDQDDAAIRIELARWLSQSLPPDRHRGSP